jgi:hypothetical protein
VSGTLIVVAPSDHGLEHAAQEIHVAAVSIFRAEFDVAHQVAREPDRQLGLLEHLVRCHAQLLLHVQGDVAMNV